MPVPLPIPLSLSRRRRPPANRALPAPAPLPRPLPVPASKNPPPLWCSAHPWSTSQVGSCPQDSQPPPTMSLQHAAVGTFSRKLGESSPLPTRGHSRPYKMSAPPIWSTKLAVYEELPLPPDWQVRALPVPPLPRFRQVETRILRSVSRTPPPTLVIHLHPGNRTHTPPSSAILSERPSRKSVISSSPGSPPRARRLADYATWTRWFDRCTSVHASNPSSLWHRQAPSRATGATNGISTFRNCLGTYFAYFTV